MVSTKYIYAGAKEGGMCTLYEKINNGTDPKICYFVNNLEPATYWNTHTTHKLHRIAIQFNTIQTI